MEFLNSILFIIILSLTINQFVLHLLPVAATDVLSHGDELNSLESTSTLVSANGNFTLGFFTFDDTTTYLGIWYNDNDEWKVWVANRDIPMTSNGKLIIDDSGTLKVISGDTTLFNVSNEVGSGNTRAVLEDSGNLVVYDAKSNRILWQSYDHPTNTLLPGMKLGYNLTTGENWTLTSWLTDEIPAPGAFTLRLETDQNSDPLLVIYRRGKVYWSLDMEAIGAVTLVQFEIVISDASGMYIIFPRLNRTDINQIMLQLSSFGELFGGDEGDHPIRWCYGNEYRESGCAFSALPKCRGQSDRFQLESGEWSGDFVEMVAALFNCC